MAPSTSTVAHSTKLVITLLCMKALGNSSNAKGRTWPIRAFQILLAHSLLGIFRFGLPFTASASSGAKHLRTFYDWHSKIVDVLPLAFFTTGILHAYGINEKVRLIVLSLGVVPILFQLSGKKNASQLRRQQLLINVTSVLQLLTITYVGLKNGNYNVISLTVSQIFERFFIDEFCYHFEIPSTDLTQYALCFIEIFAMLTLNEL